MSTGGTYIGSLSADYDVTTVAAFPNLDFALLEDLCGLYVMK